MPKLKFWVTLAAGALFAAQVFGTELKIGLAEDPDVLDPAQGRTFVGRIVFTSLCDKLVTVTPDLKIAPQLATSWAWSEGDTVLTMQLRPNVTFHDGTPLDAQAVAFTITRNLTLPESRRKSEISTVAKVEATGPLEVKFTLKSPDATLLAQLSDRAGMIVSPKAVADLGANFSANPVCAGPYKFVERVHQDRIVLEKYPGYWDKEHVFIDKVTFLPIVDSTVRLANLRSGDLDMIERLAPTDVGTVKGDAKLALQEVVGIGYMALYINIANGPAADNPFGKDKRVRQAFSQAIDREALLQITMEGAAVTGNQPYNPQSLWFDKALPVPARDIAKAKALLKEAGLATVPVELMVSNSPLQQQMMQVVQAMVAEAGFEVKLKTAEFATLLNEQAAGKFQVSRVDWSGRIDPDGNLHQFVTCKGGINDMKYCNPQVDALLNAARETNDQAARKQKYDAAAVILDDELPIIYLGHTKWQWALNKTVKGFIPSPDGMIRIVDMTKGN